MKLEDLGYNDKLEEFRKSQELDNFEIGRVISEHKERFIVKTLQGECEAEITGNMRFTAENREDYPAVGDWVALKIYDDNFAIIHKIFPRFSSIKRQAVGKSGQIQIIATNIEYAFIIQAIDRDFNINRLERYLTICYTSNVSPIILLSKIDLIDVQSLNEIVNSIKVRIPDVPIITISNKTKNGYDKIKKIIKQGKTYCLLGSSGVGKSTLINNLYGSDIMRTDKISCSTRKGRHITSHRELIILKDGGMLIDNPGMREVGITDLTSAFETTFNMISDLSVHCKFKDCTHTQEKGCAVIQAVAKGEIDKALYANYLKMKKEKEHFESSIIIEKRQKEKKIGKMIKQYKKDMKKFKS